MPPNDPKEQAVRPRKSESRAQREDREGRRVTLNEVREGANAVRLHFHHLDTCLDISNKVQHRKYIQNRLGVG